MIATLLRSADPAVRRLAGDNHADVLASSRVRTLLDFPHGVCGFSALTMALNTRRRFSASGLLPRGRSVDECSRPAHHDLNLLEQGHRERDERHEQRGAGESVRHERRRVGGRRAGDEVRLRQHEWLARKQRLPHHPMPAITSSMLASKWCW